MKYIINASTRLKESHRRVIYALSLFGIIGSSSFVLMSMQSDNINTQPSDNTPYTITSSDTIPDTTTLYITEPIDGTLFIDTFDDNNLNFTNSAQLE